VTGRAARRQMLAWGLALGLSVAFSSFAAPAWAGSYLVRAALLVSGAQRDADALRKRPHDKELARVVHQLAQERVRTAATMEVPKDVVLAHPHLGLVLENYERAADAARNGQMERFLVLLVKAREEEQTLRAVLKQLGWELPKD
jgi:hypothetical protein